MKKQANKKLIIALLCIAAAGVTLTGCMDRGKVGTAAATTAPATMQPLATMSPEATMGMNATMSPEMSLAPVATMEPSATSGADTGADANATATAMTPAEAGKLAEKISEAVERLSEVDDAEAVVSGNRALVAVEFDDQYSAGLDERMKQMITEAVQEVDETLTDVRITDDDTLYGQVKGLGERLAKATGLDELADDFGDLWDRLLGK